MATSDKYIHLKITGKYHGLLGKKTSGISCHSNHRFLSIKFLCHIFNTFVYTYFFLSWKGSRQYYCPPLVEMITITLNAEQFSFKAK